MKYIEYLQTYDNFDKYILFLDELGFSDINISSMLNVTRQTIYNAKKRNATLLEALKSLTSESKSYGDAGINTIISAFNNTFGTTKASRWDRYAAKRLSARYGAENITAVIRALGDMKGAAYMPSVNSVQQLEEKWVSVGNFLTKMGNNTKVINI